MLARFGGGAAEGKSAFYVFLSISCLSGYGVAIASGAFAFNICECYVLCAVSHVLGMVTLEGSRQPATHAAFG